MGGFLETLRNLFTPARPTMAEPGWMVVGLGNPGAEYDHTRHNVGFDVVDAMAASAGLTWRDERLGPAWVARGEGWCFIKPLTYMNLSGAAARGWLQWFKWPVERLLVVVDDVALPLGEIRLRPDGSAGGHNGLRSIEQQLGSNGYARLRCGVGPITPGWSLEKFVLGRFRAEEEELRRDMTAKAAEAVSAWRNLGLEKAMNRYNGKTKKKSKEKTDPNEN